MDSGVAFRTGVIFLDVREIELTGEHENPANNSEASGSGIVELFENTLTNRKRGKIYRKRPRQGLTSADAEMLGFLIEAVEIVEDAGHRYSDL